MDFLDIEELNRALIEGKCPIAKGSFAIINKLAGHYEVMPTGAAVGRGVGPVLVGTPNLRMSNRARIGLPGENTTAHKLFRYWLAAQGDLQPVLTQMPFYEMLPALKKGTLDAAVLIHEGRFVYAEQGLNLIADLGAFWEEKTQAMIPLGCIYADVSLPQEIKDVFIRDLRESLSISTAAFAAGSAPYKEKILPYMQLFAQEKDAAVTEAHVRTYVTSDTENLSAEAFKAIDVFKAACLQ